MASKLPIGIQSFEDLRSKGFKYIDKTGRQVVILVDEYDKPMLQAVDNPDLQDTYRAILKGFYCALKSMDRCIRFAFLTGVTKFGKVSVFSDLNNLRDLSMLPQYYDICGITAESSYFTEDDRELPIQGVYNPFSVLNALANSLIGSYWFETGTPSYLVQLLQKYDYNLE